MLPKTLNSTLGTAHLEHSSDALKNLISLPENTNEKDLAKIHQLFNPPLTRLSADKIFIRQCKLAGDEIDAHGGCFRSKDLPHLLELTQGAPALIAHNRQTSAVARFFGGNILTVGEHHYIAPKFYWPREHSEASDLRLLIDTGIINEASIAFTFEKAECNICGCDIRECAHMPFETYDEKVCHYWYHNVIKVLEGSFVYRGAEPGTGFLERYPQILPNHQLKITIDGISYTSSSTQPPSKKADHES